MRRLLYAIALVAASLPASTAHADPSMLSWAGYGCGFSTTSDPSGALANPGTQVGYASAGPVVTAGLVGIDATDPTNPAVDPGPLLDNPASAELICDIQVGGTGHFSDADATHVVSSRGTVVPYLPPTLIAYTASATDAVWACTTLRLYDTAGAGIDLYADSVTGEFMTDPSTATCDLGIAQDIPPDEACDTDPTVCDLPVGRRDPGDKKQKKRDAPQQPFICAAGVDSATCVYY